jgi:3-methyl-2-oxobutanoate hydroxymethyltransferase
MTERRMTVPAFTALKAAGQKIAMLTAYDYTMASLLDAAGVEGILVGDSLSMVVQGHDTTLPVTLDQMIYHAEMVGRAVKRALVVVDMPFPTFHLGRHKAVENAGRILKETRCQAVKLEGGIDQAEVMVQRQREQLLRDAKAAEQAGAFAMVLESVPSELAAEITQAVKIPTIGIGAGTGCDGQVLVTYDLLGLTVGYVPRFVKTYADLKAIITGAVAQYRDEIRSGKFPGPEQTYK